MKKTILDISEISDSKEIYSQRPNPFIAGFIYCLVALLAAAILYCCIGKMDIVASASGIVRPNDDVSTVSSLISGRVNEVHYSDGQFVQEGDVLLSIDVSDKLISLDAVEKAEEENDFRLQMLDKFLDGIQKGSNPFSPKSSGREYPYYVQFKGYELNLQNTKDSYDFDEKKSAANLQTLTAQVNDIQDRINGLICYRDSVENGENLCADYPEYERLYLLYAAGAKQTDNEYQAQQDSIARDLTKEENEYYLAQNQAAAEEYEYLVSSIEAGKPTFPSDHTGLCCQLYNDYLAELEEYDRNYQRTVIQYEYILNGGSVGSSGEALLEYDRTMLEGYELYRQSVESDSDMFDASKPSVYYRHLYTEYKSKYDGLLAADPAQAELFRSETLADIGNTVMIVTASIAEKEITLGLPSSDYDLKNAEFEMQSAQAAVEAFKASKLLEYKNALGECANRAAQYQLALSQMQDRESRLSALDAAYNSSKEQNRLQTVSQIDSSIQAAQAELSSAQSNLRLYQITDDMYRNTGDGDGTPITVSLASIQEISSVLSQQDSVRAQLDECETQKKQLEEQIELGIIKAERAGIVSVNNVFVAGDTMAAGTVIATVIPFNESEYKVNLYVKNSDIANLEVGDRIKYNLSALPSSQYGTVEGVVTKISSDTLIQDGQYSGYYLVEGSISGAELTDKNGNTASVSIGMQLEAKIVTQRKTIIRYLLEKIDLF